MYLLTNVITMLMIPSASSTFLASMFPVHERACVIPLIKMASNLRSNLRRR